MLFSQVLAAAVADRGGLTTPVPPDWLQGRSLFGGLQVALAVRAMRLLVPPDLPLRVVQTTFLAPVPAGPVHARAQVLRTGKNVTHVEARLLAGDQTACLVVGVFGRGRPSGVTVAPPPSAPLPAGADAIPPVPPLGVAAFTQYFTMRWVDGDLPFSGSTRPDVRIEVSLRDEGPTSEEHLVAIADAPPPHALSFLREPVFGSSLTWTLELLAHDFDRWSLQGWLLDVELAAARDGYTSQSILVRAPGGAPVALSRQSMVVFG
jgi:acyl-CoA thioesterase